MKKEVNINIVLNYLNDNRLLFLIEYKIIKYREPDFEFDVFSHKESYLLVQKMPYGIYASIINFTYENYIIFLDYLHKNFSHFSLVITFPPETMIQDSLLDNASVYKTFVGNEIISNNHVQSDSIKIASIEDHLMINSFEEEKSKNKITLREAFDEYVVNNTGEIYLYFKEGELAGYLICSKEVENIWDVIYIYVKPELRNKGIGRKLANKYLSDKVSANQIPLYTGVSNIASEKVAIDSGFELCSTIIYKNY